MRNLTEDITACMTNTWKQFSFKLEDAKGLNVEVYYLDKTRVELKDLTHESRKTFVFLDNLVPRITLIALLFRCSQSLKVSTKTRSHGIELIDNFLSNQLKETRNQHF